MPRIALVFLILGLVLGLAPTFAAEEAEPHESGSQMREHQATGERPLAEELGTDVPFLVDDPELARLLKEFTEEDAKRRGIQATTEDP